MVLSLTLQENQRSEMGNLSSMEKRKDAKGQDVSSLT